MAQLLRTHEALAENPGSHQAHGDSQWTAPDFEEICHPFLTSFGPQAPDNALIYRHGKHSRA